MASYMILIIAGLALVLVLIGINYVMVSRLYSDNPNTPKTPAAALKEPERGLKQEPLEIFQETGTKEVKITDAVSDGQHEKRKLMVKDDHYRQTLKAFRESHHNGDSEKKTSTVSADHEYRQAMRSMGHKKID